MRVYSRCGCVSPRVAFALAGSISMLASGLTGSDVAHATSSGPISGMARVVDGDTIEVAGTKIRLEGIDAPESGQTCARKWLGIVSGTWACGTKAADELTRLVSRQPISCDATGTDKYGRTLAICHAGNVDLNAHMVRQGLAWAFVKYSRRYVPEENAARAEGLGIWQAPTMTAWDFRAGQWQQAAVEAPKGCAIKGNMSKNGQIYHMPWSPWYAKVRMDDAPGKRWFCSEAEAVAAGWRPAQMTH